MGDTVQRLMEDMVPELEDLAQRTLFSKTEIQSIVSSRQSFEYKLRRQNISKLDFLRYIQYELNLGALLEKRKAKLGQEKKGVAEFAAMRRLAFLYERALRKFNHDIQLWKQYLEYCRSTGSFHAINKILPRALQLNPKEESLWILHAEWEENMQGNMDGARTILQRGLRLNANSQPLWLKFFELEIKFLQKILERKRLLGLVRKSKHQLEEEDEEAREKGDNPEIDLRFQGGGNNDDKKAPLKVGDLVPKAGGISEEMKDKQNEALMFCMIPRTIYRNAIQTKLLKNNLEFRLKFFQMIPSAFSAALSALNFSYSQANAKEGVNDGNVTSLSEYAFNLNERDELAVNFLQFNDESISIANADIYQQNQKDSASEMPYKSFKKGGYHINFLPLIEEILSSIRRDFGYDMNATYIQAEFEYTKERIRQDFEAELVETLVKQENKQLPEQVACEAFEAALSEDGMRRIEGACKAYLAAHRAELEIGNNSNAGSKAVDDNLATSLELELCLPKDRAAFLSKLSNPRAELCKLYLDFCMRLLKNSSATMQQTKAAYQWISKHLQKLYENFIKERGIYDESILYQHVEFLLENGHAKQAIEAFEEVLLSSTSSSAPAAASSAKAAMKSSVNLWLRYLQLLETMHAFSSVEEGDATEEKDTADVDMETNENSRKRKKGSSSVATTTTSLSISTAHVLSRYNDALVSVAFLHRTPLYERLLNFVQNQFTIHPTVANYVAVHHTFQKMAFQIPQPPLSVVQQLKVAYVQWIHVVALSEAYSVLSSQKQQKSSSSSSSQSSQAHTKKKQKTSSSTSKFSRADSSDDDDDDAAVPRNLAGASAVASFIPAITLEPFQAVRHVIDQCLASPPFSLPLLQLCLHVESTLASSPTSIHNTSATPSSSSAAASSSQQHQLHLRRMKELYERGVQAFGSTCAELWFDYLSFARLHKNIQLANANQIHFRATKELKSEQQAHWAELQTRLVQ